MTDREKAILWARDILKKEPLFLDTETTGIGMFDQIVEIAVVDAAGKTVFHSYVKPAIPIPAAATRIHGIKDSDVFGAPGFSELWPKLREILRRRVVVIYNREYDERMMLQSATADVARDMLEGDWKGEVCCAMLRYAEFYGDWNDYHGNYRWQKLTDAARRCGISTDGAHGAEADALMTWGVVKCMAETPVKGDES